MTFKRWLHDTDLSGSTIKKYLSAVFGSISNWASEADLIKSSVIEISDPQTFEVLSEKIQKLPTFQERNERGNNMYSSALKKYQEFLSANHDELENDLEEIISNSDYSETEKKTLIKSRIGQGKFRDDLFNYWNGCAVTGFRIPSMLIASHIKPWRESDSNERLDKFNGLLLTPNLDKAFDAGLISFDKHGEILVSDTLTSPIDIGIKEDMRITIEATHQLYLEYHRDVIYLSY